MKISFQWLKDHFSSDINIEQASELLSSSGLEVEGIEVAEQVTGGLKGIVVGEVVTKERIPDTEKLSITTVNIGNEIPLSIVCGASNVAAGQKVLVATHGTTIHTINGESITIKKGKIRGQVSEGMICAEDEIGLGDSHEGIMVLKDDAKPGTPAAEYLNLSSDHILEIGLTANRGDAASHRGVARDLVAVLNAREYIAELKSPGPTEIKTSACPITVEIQDTTGCPRYSGALIKNVRVADSPSWLKSRLTSIGLKPINNIVDITNYILHDLGQPLHAFDADKIKGNKVIIKTARQDEEFMTLDDVTRKLNDYDLVIADESDPMCIAGVFGGAGSGITSSSVNVFLESAYFDPGYIRKTSKAHGLKTDASFRFERGTDPEITMNALGKAIQMILDIAGGELAGLTDQYPNKVHPFHIDLKYSNLERLTGIAVPKEKTKKILLDLEIKIKSENESGLSLEVPVFKSDVTREVDVIEEILRTYGYHHIPDSTSIKAVKGLSYHADKDKFRNRIAEILSGQGFYEVMNTSLTKIAYRELDPEMKEESVVTLLNPLSQDLNELRRTLSYGMLESIAYNLNRQASGLQIYEMGNIYFKQENKDFPYSEKQMLSLAICGERYARTWNDNEKNADIYLLKGMIAMLLEKLGIKGYKEVVSKKSIFSSSLDYELNGKVIFSAGIINRKILKAFDIDQPVFIAESEIGLLQKAASKNKVEYTELPKFPEVRRDLSLVLDTTVPYSKVKEIITSSEKTILKRVTLFDIYEGDKMEKGKRSIAVSLYLQDSGSTLKDQQIEKVVEKIVSSLEEKVGAKLRG